VSRKNHCATCGVANPNAFHRAICSAETKGKEAYEKEILLPEGNPYKSDAAVAFMRGYTNARDADRTL
jgi:hypothetical protein